MSDKPADMLRVTASRDDIRCAYDKIGLVYGVVETLFEKKLRLRALAVLSVKPGETVLEIGLGTGYAMKEIAAAVGPSGQTVGLDITPRMLNKTAKRVGRAGLADRVELVRGDAVSLPFGNDRFDAVYMTSTLELFDTPDITLVLQQVNRVLKPGGRFCVGSLSLPGSDKHFFARLYAFWHKVFPAYISCRAIYVDDLVKMAGFDVEKTEDMVLSGLPRRVVLARKPAA